MLGRLVNNLRYSLKYRIAGIIFILEAIMMTSVLGVTLSYSMQKSQQQWATTETVMMNLLGDLSRIALFTGEYGELQAYIEQVINDPHIETVVLADRNNNIAVTSKLSLIGMKLPDYNSTENQNWQTQHWRSMKIQNLSGPLGTLAIRFSNESLFQANRAVMNLGIWIALTGMILIAIIGIIIGHILTRKLEVLKSVARDFSKGHLDTRTGFGGKDEVSIVGRTFDEMAERVAEDVKELYKARESLEQRVRERTIELASARDEAVQATRSKSAFLANMSHEIRTPLTAIIGFTQTLQEDELSTDERSEYLNIINRSSKHLLQLINDILDLSKIEAEKLSVELLKTNPTEIITDVSSLVRMLAEAKGLSIEVEYKKPVPEWITSDPVRLKQILINLCNNAVKFTQQGGVMISVDCDTQNELITFKIVDTGIGLSEQQIDNLFQAFSQADSSTTRKYGGTGLGLHLSKQLANKLGGDITVKSTPGIGSCFCLSIPTGSLVGVKLVDGSASEVPQNPDRDAPLINKSYAHTHILLAEDNEDNQRYISTLLKATGADFKIAQNGAEAVAMAMQGDFDLILMDMQMPVLNGLDATKQLRGNAYDKPIIALTANYSSSDIETYLAAGCTAHLAKPIERQLFFKAIEKYIDTTHSTTTPGNSMSNETDDFDEEIANAIKMFIERLPGMLTAICEKFESRDTEQLKELIHDLKGTSGNFGYDDLYAISQQMEELVKNGLLDEFGIALQEAEKIVQAVILHPEKSSMIF